MISDVATHLSSELRETVLSGVEYYDDAFVARFEKKVVAIERYLVGLEDGAGAKLLNDAVNILEELRRNLSNAGKYCICRDDGRATEPIEKLYFKGIFERADNLVDSFNNLTSRILKEE